MVLAVDIGNTDIVIGGFEDDALSFVAGVSTHAKKTEDEYAVAFMSVLLLYDVDKTSVEGAIVSSVVPMLNNTVKNALRSAFGVDAMVVGPGIKTGINIRCDAPSTVGTDIICAAVAAHNFYGSPSLVIDMGTATKMLAIDKSGTFVGVSIIPGVNVSLKALVDSAAQLPQISLEAPRSVIGKNTTDSMRSGVLLGTASMLDGMIDRFAKEIGYDLPVIATGGIAEAVIPFCDHVITIDKHLVLKGLNIIYGKNV